MSAALLTVVGGWAAVARTAQADALALERWRPSAAAEAIRRAEPRMFATAAGDATRIALEPESSAASSADEAVPGLTIPAQPAAAPATPPAAESGTVAVAEPGKAAVGGPKAAAPAARRGALPVGKGMWLYLPEQVEGGDVDALVARATAVGLTHIYVRTGSSRMGFYAWEYLNAVLPKAHAAGIRVYGWDFPYLDDPFVDAERALHAMRHTTPDGHRIDGFVADIETPSEGTNLTPERAFEYGRLVREWAGPEYPLVVAVPRPSEQMKRRYPYTEVVAHFDAIAPMIYWLNRQPDTDVAGALQELAAFGKPLIPVGQAYDGAPEGGRPGPPPPEEIQRFLTAAEEHGASGASLWSWQHASPEIWDTFARAEQFRTPSPDTPAAALRPSQIRGLQSLLRMWGDAPRPVTGAWDASDEAALRSYQAAARVPGTGVLDARTISFLHLPQPPPLRPAG